MYWGRRRNQNTELIRQFRDITSTSEKVANDFLKKANWNLERAIDNYYNQTGGSLIEERTTVNTKRLTELFEKYKKIGIDEGGDEDVDAIQNEGMAAFIKDIGLDLEDVMTLVIVWKLKCKTQYQIHRDEFINNLYDLGIDSISSLKNKLPAWKRELNNPNRFKNFYNFTFEYNRASEAKSIPHDLAIALWKVILKGKFKNLDKWCEYVEKYYKKSITRDTWQQFYEFTQVFGTDYSDYDFNGAWPTLIDEFVEWMQKKCPPKEEKK